MGFNPPSYEEAAPAPAPAGTKERFSAAAYSNDGKHHILLAASGSVATIKLPLIAQVLSTYQNVSIRILLTENAKAFLQGQAKEQPTLEQIGRYTGVDGVYTDPDEWAKPWVRGDKILHIELRRWADVLVVAPLSANTLAKLANGLSDNLLTSVARAWDVSGVIDGKKKSIMVAPAMNTAMWRHPITKKQLRGIVEDWTDDEGKTAIVVLRPMEKELACGDLGDGAMMEWTRIVERMVQHLDLKGE